MATISAMVPRVTQSQVLPSESRQMPIGSGAKSSKITRQLTIKNTSGSRSSRRILPSGTPPYLQISSSMEIATEAPTTASAAPTQSSSVPTLNAVFSPGLTLRSPE